MPAEKLFTVNIGLLEDEIDLFHRGLVLPNRKNRVFMYQGLIFVANSLGAKIMEFSSYGDLLSLKYNEDQNPRPVLLSPLQSEDTIVNRTAVVFPFNDIGEIAVTSNHVLLAEDHVAPERRLIDQDSAAVLQHVVHRFAPDGQHLDYIGQEGVGGTPFAHIMGLEVTSNDHIVVTTRNGPEYEVFWYNAEGDALFAVRIDEAHLPAGPDPSISPSLSGIRPDTEDLRLYMQIDYILPENRGVESRVYSLDLPEGIYRDFFLLPENTQTLPGAGGMQEIQYLYDFIGTADGGHLFFLGRTSGFEQSLIIMDRNGNLISRRRLRIENPEIFASDYQVSRDGIITGLLGDPEGVDIYWWRADRLLR